MSTPYTLPSGCQVALSADGKTARNAEPGKPLEPGWHLMTHAEFEAHIDQIIGMAYARLENDPDPRVRHSFRFRKVSNRYPQVVALAYEHDLARAAADSDEQVAATVAAWEHSQGIEPRDWHAIGAAERDEVEESPAA